MSWEALAALVAAGAAVGSSVVTFVCVRMQIRATIVSAGRQRWVEQLREAANKLLFELSRFRGFVAKCDLKPQSLNDRTRRIDAVNFRIGRVQFLLDRADSKQNELSDLLQSLIEISAPTGPDDVVDIEESAIRDRQRKIVDLVEAIIRREVDLARKCK